MRCDRAAWTIWLGSIACCAAPSTALAHGGSARIAAVSAVDGDGRPWLLRAGEGLVRRGPGGFSFVCPATFGAATIVDALAENEDMAWIVTTRGLHRLSADGTVAAVGTRCADEVLQLVAHRGKVYALARDASGDGAVVCVLREDGAHELFTSADRVDGQVAGLASDGDQLWLARRAGGMAFELATLDAAGTPSAWTTFTLPMAAQSVQLSAAGATLFVNLVGYGMHALLRVDADQLSPVLEGPLPLRGPIAAGEASFALSGQALYTSSDASFAPVFGAPSFDALDGHDGFGFALARGALYRLPLLPGTDGPQLTLDDVGPPETDDETCLAQWRRFAPALHDHALAIDGGAPDAAEPTRVEASKQASIASCAISASGSASSAPWSLLLAAHTLFIWRIRQRMESHS